MTGKRRQHFKDPKICSRCDEYFENNHRFGWELPICEDCVNKGLKPLGYHSYWGCTCEWCLENKTPCKHCGCNVQDEEGDICNHCQDEDHKELGWRWVRIGPWDKRRCSVRYFRYEPHTYACRECAGGDCHQCLEELCSCNHKDKMRDLLRKLVENDNDD